MLRQQREKFTTPVTSEKNHPGKPFVQFEGELDEAQLEAIAGGGINLNMDFHGGKSPLNLGL